MKSCNIFCVAIKSCSVNRWLGKSEQAMWRNELGQDQGLPYGYLLIYFQCCTQPDKSDQGEIRAQTRKIPKNLKSQQYLAVMLSIQCFWRGCLLIFLSLCFILFISLFTFILIYIVLFYFIYFQLIYIFFICFWFVTLFYSSILTLITITIPTIPDQQTLILCPDNCSIIDRKSSPEVQHHYIHFLQKTLKLALEQSYFDKMNTSQNDIPTKHLLQQQGMEDYMRQVEQKPQYEKRKLEVGKKRTLRINSYRANEKQYLKKCQKTTEKQKQKQVSSNKTQISQIAQDQQTISTNHYPQLPSFPNDSLQAFTFMNQLSTIQKKQLELRKQSHHIICKLTSIIILICLFFITLLKVFLFFSTQFIATIIQSFKQQLFDPAITNDELELEIFYIEEACFLITTILMFLFIVFCTIMANKYYVGSLRVYRRNCRVVRGLEERKKIILQWGKPAMRGHSFDEYK